jgi:hypothetical protein
MALQVQNVNALNKLINMYMFGAFTHGFTRTMYYTRNTCITEHDHKYKLHTRQTLVTEMLQYSTLNGVLNIFLSPFTVIDDISTFEAYMRGIKKYSKPLLFPGLSYDSE